MCCTVYGYGFVFDEVCSEESEMKTVMDFVLHHSKAFQNTVKEIEIVKVLQKLKIRQVLGANITEDLENEIWDIKDFYVNESYNETGIGAMIAAIMRRETGIPFRYVLSCDEYGTESAIFWQSTCPWMMNAKNEKLKEYLLHDICKKYMNELGISTEPKELALTY